jgi:hypothetical protein
VIERLQRTEPLGEGTPFLSQSTVRLQSAALFAVRSLSRRSAAHRSGDRSIGRFPFSQSTTRTTAEAIILPVDGHGHHRRRAREERDCPRSQWAGTRAESPPDMDRSSESAGGAALLAAMQVVCSGEKERVYVCVYGTGERQT